MNTTPGPWNVDKWNTDDGITVWGDYKQEVVCTVGNGANEREKEEANARLIAASPDMAEHISLMLRTVNDTLRHGLTEGQAEALGEMCDQARAILAATRGR